MIINSEENLDLQLQTLRNQIELGHNLDALKELYQLKIIYPDHDQIKKLIKVANRNIEAKTPEETATGAAPIFWLGFAILVGARILYSLHEPAFVLFAIVGIVFELLTLFVLFYMKGGEALLTKARYPFWIGYILQLIAQALNQFPLAFLAFLVAVISLGFDILAIRVWLRGNNR